MRMEFDAYGLHMLKRKAIHAAAYFDSLSAHISPKREYRQAAEGLLAVIDSDPKISYFVDNEEKNQISSRYRSALAAPLENDSDYDPLIAFCTVLADRARHELWGINRPQEDAA